MKEEWKDIKGYEGLYKVSNSGRVKSLKREVWNGRGFMTVKEKIRKNFLNTQGYYFIRLSNNGEDKNYTIHKLVAMSFLNHTPNGYNEIVDHIDNNPLNNNVGNLQLISNRKNSSKDKVDCGITWCKQRDKYLSSIYINGQSIHIGYTTDKQLALQWYNTALENISLLKDTSCKKQRKRFREYVKNN